MFAPKVGVFGVGQLNGIVEIASDRPLLPWQPNDDFQTLNSLKSKTWLIQEIEPRMLHQTGVFKVKQFNGVVEI